MTGIKVKVLRIIYAFKVRAQFDLMCRSKGILDGSIFLTSNDLVIENAHTGFKCLEASLTIQCAIETFQILSAF
jgi:hypothetical protein